MIKSAKRFIAILVAVLLITMLLASCGSSKTDNTAQGSSQAQSGTQAASTAAADPLAKYAPQDGKTYTIKYLTNGYAAVEPGSKVVKKFEDTFNVKMDVSYVDSSKWDDLINLRFASGDLPDVLAIPSPDKLSKFASQGLLAEVPMNLIDKYAPNLEMAINNDAPTAWYTSKVDGKNYGIPYIIGGNGEHDPIIWRTDWLKNVGIDKVPETISEYEDAFNKFVNNDPDKDGKKDTYALSTTGLTPIFGAFGVINYLADKDAGRPSKVYWIEKDGQLINSAIQPETKQALALLAKWYKEGFIDPEFVTGESKGGSWTVSTDFVNGKIGFSCLGYNYDWTNKNDATFQGDDTDALAKIDPKATFAFGQPPIGPDGKTRGTGAFSPVTGISYAFTKNLNDDPGKLGKLLQMFDWPEQSHDNWMYNVFGELGTDYTMTTNAGYTQPTRSKETSDYTVQYKKGFYQFFYEPDKANQATLWPQYSAFIDKIGYNQYGVSNALVAPLPSAGKYMADLEKMREEAFFQIITGEKPVDYFDTFVSDWKAAGGDQILKEANDWYSSVK